RPNSRKIFQNQIVIVTGASRGIGAATAEAFANNGARVVIVSRNLKKLLSVRNKIQRRCGGSNVLAMKVDIGVERQVINLFQMVLKHWGRPEILINNAGVVIKRDLLKTSSSDWSRILKTNLTGTFLCLREAAKAMRRGQIINISSLSGIGGLKKF